MGMPIFTLFSSVSQSCPTLCDPMDYSTPGFPVHHQLLEFTLTHVIESVMPSNSLFLCCPLLLLLSIFPSIRVFSNESALRIRWPKYWCFSFKISPSNELIHNCQNSYGTKIFFSKWMNKLWFIQTMEYYSQQKWKWATNSWKDMKEA